MTSVSHWCAVFLAGTAGCLLAGPRAIRALAALRWIQPARYEDCPALMPIQQAKRGTPTMGGLLVLAVATATAVPFGGVAQCEGWVVLGTIGVMGLLGFIDDALKLSRPNAGGLRSWPKLLAALAVGGLVGVMLSDLSPDYRRVIMPWSGSTVDLGAAWVPFAMLVIAGCAHAVNLTDGMDGLAVGCLVPAFGVLGFVAVADPQTRGAAIWSAGLAGACLGFLWFNSCPASVFLGDVGALGLGAALGALALLTHSAVGLVIFGGVFVAEALSVMLQVASYRWRNKRRVFRVAPLHHHFQLGGVAEPKLVVRFWVAGLLLAAIGAAGLHRPWR